MPAYFVPPKPGGFQRACLPTSTNPTCPAFLSLHKHLLYASFLSSCNKRVLCPLSSFLSSATTTSTFNPIILQWTTALIFKHQPPASTCTLEPPSINLQLQPPKHQPPSFKLRTAHCTSTSCLLVPSWSFTANPTI